MIRRKQDVVSCALVLLSLSFTGVVEAEENWPRFRGPNGKGLAEDVVFPTKWTDQDYAWQRTLPGRGHSSPVVWGDTLFVTCGDELQAQLLLLALDVRTGQEKWSQAFVIAAHSMHRFNSYASCTPAVDQYHVYLALGSPEAVLLVAITHGGDEIWRRDLGPFAADHGFGASPIVVDDNVVFALDHQGKSSVMALDVETGDTRWEVERNSDRASYSTPCVLRRDDGGTEVVLQSKTEGVVGITLVQGKVRWQLRDVLPDRCVTSPLVAEGMIVCSCGSGGNGRQLVGVIPADGDILPARIAYELTKAVPNVPTPIARDELLFIWHDRGTVSCRDLQTGQLHWLERVGGNYYGSPVCAGGRLYCIADDGEVVVLAAASKFAELGRSYLNDPSHATPAISGARMFLRTESSLACLPAG